MHGINLYIAIIIISITTFLTRAFPFILFGREDKSPPRIITYLGKYLPPAIIFGIVIYCFKDTSFTNYPYGIKEIIAVATVIILHLWKRNSMISIFSGTIVYMILVQFVFI